MHIKNLLIKNIIITQINILNQITTNKVLDNNSTNKINYLNNCLYAPTNNLTKTIRIKTNRIKSTGIKAFNKSYNKTFISYNHFKGSKKAFNYKTYKSIKLVRFWLKGALECFKIDINKIVRLKIYKWSLVKIMLLISTNKIILKIILISSFGWRDIITKKVWSKTSKIDKVVRFGVYLNLILG